jgi:glycine/serine hydroxymethyltransferase
MEPIVELIDRVISDFENEKLISDAKAEVNKMMSQFQLFAD